MTGTDLDPLIHAPARLKIVVTLAALAEGDAVTFTRLQSLTALTAGNFITHIRKLQDAGYVKSRKSGSGSSSQTSIELTAAGRRALSDYRNALNALLGNL